MGKFKNLMIDKMNKEAEDERNFIHFGIEPKPIKVKDGKKQWEIEGYRIWAVTYTQALDLLPIMKSL